jgi:hypothetical protein
MERSIKEGEMVTLATEERILIAHDKEVSPLIVVGIMTRCALEFT